MKVLVTGATGLVGKRLCEKLTERGHQIVKLVRKVNNPENEFLWDLDRNFVEERCFDGVEAIIHLAGENVSKRWTEDYKRKIVTSRIKSAKLLHHLLCRRNQHIHVFISASGVNYYGTFTSDQILTETSRIQHQDFLSDVCIEWERAADDFSDIAERVVKLRTAIVLSKQGGPLEKLMSLVDYNIATPVGTGKQWMNWIHLEDLTDMYISALENPLQGSYNACADEPVENRIFMRTFADVKNKKFWDIPIPAALLKLSLGEMSEIILESTRTSNEKIKSTGFQFQYTHLKQALENLLIE